MKSAADQAIFAVIRTCALCVRAAERSARMTRLAAAYVAAATVLVVLDLTWLSYAAKAFFEPALGPLLAEKTNNLAAVLFYVLYVAGIIVFAVLPALRGGDGTTALLMGAAFGFFAYMTYDLTNMATLKGWPAWLAAMDISWGALVTALAASAGYFAASRIA
jgi:uncharacterized membrane protein